MLSSGCEDEGDNLSIGPQDSWFQRIIIETRLLVAGPILRNAASLWGGTVVTSLLGFVYWWVVARMLPVGEVGTASAVLSAVQFISTVCVFGLGTLLIAELSQDPTIARTFMLTSVSGSGLLASVVAIVAGLILRDTSHSLHVGLYPLVAIASFALVSAADCVSRILDDACVGLLRADLQLRRNTVFSIVKLVVVVPLIFWWPASSGTEVVLAWLIGICVSLVVLFRRLNEVTSGQQYGIQPGLLKRNAQAILNHHWLNISITAPRLILPTIVTITLGPADGAAYFIASQIVIFANIIPVHLSTVLFALTPGDEQALKTETRRTMGLCVVLSVVSGIAFAVMAPYILEIFSHSYTTATSALVILGLTTFPAAMKAHYVAISRVHGRMNTAAYWTTVGAILEIGIATVGGKMGGITGVAVGFLVAQLIEAVAFAPVVVSTLRA